MFVSVEGVVCVVLLIAIGLVEYRSYKIAQKYWEKLDRKFSALNEEESTENPAVAAIKYAIENPGESPVEFLRCWYEGDFNALRTEWENVPEEVFIGADPLHPQTKSTTNL